MAERTTPARGAAAGVGSGAARNLRIRGERRRGKDRDGQEGFAGDFGRRVAGRADDVRRWCERGSAGAHLGRRAAGRRPMKEGMAAC